MRTAFFIVMLFIAFISAMDIVFGDADRKNDQITVAGALGIRPSRRHQGSVAALLIVVAAMTALLIAEVLV